MTKQRTRPLRIFEAHVGAGSRACELYFTKGLHQLPLVVKKRRGFCKFTLVLETFIQAFSLGSYWGHLFVLDQN